MTGARYFRSTPAVYVDVCAQLDAAWGYPNAETKTLRALPLAEELPADDEGRVYLSVAAEYCDYILPSQLLPELIAAGLVEELSEAEYAVVLPPSPYG
jgi:hypothetical protein